MERIVIIAPYRDFGVMAKQLAKEMNIKVEVYEGWMEHIGDFIKIIPGREIDVVISRGGTADYIARHVQAPVLSVNASFYDLLECCEAARRQSRQIVLTSYKQPFAGTYLIEKAMDIQIAHLVFNRLADIYEQLGVYAAAGNYCVVGGGPTVQAARRLGLPSVILRTGRDTIRDALQRAAEIARIRYKQRRLQSTLQVLADVVQEGVVLMAADGRIESFNSGAERLLKVPAATVIGRQVDEVLPDLGLGEVLKTGKVSQRQSRNLGVSCIPIKDGTEVVGAVAAVNEIPQYGQFGRGPWFDKNKNEFRAKYRLEDIIGNSVAIVEAKTLARRFAASDNTVLIYGPSGSGKEMFAQGIHNASARMAKPFVAINCAALPVTLLESELFGYDEGAFTGARRKGKAGLFELAAGGTVFLDEIDAMPIELQGRLLRVVQEREIIRVGGETVIPVDIRVIAATNKVPHELVSANKLREDLYYRLNVLYLELPSLAARREDIPLLCQSFLTSAQYEQLYPLLTKVLAQLQHYTWPGNVRELQNFCQRLWFYWEAAGETDDIPRLLSKLVPNMAAGVKTVPDNLHSMVASYEQDVIRRVVAETGSIRKAAKILGVGKSTIARKLKRQ